MQRLRKFAKYSLLAYRLTLITINWQSWRGLFFFTKSYFNNEYASPKPVNKLGRYSAMYDLVQLNSRARVHYLSSALDRLQLNYRIDTLLMGQANLFVFGDTSQPISLITAHHDGLEQENYRVNLVEWP